MDSNSGTIRYEYNTLGSKTKMITPEGKAITYTYDDANRLSGISALNFEHGTQNWSYTYDALGRRSKLTYPNKATANYIYDSAGRLTSLYHKTSKGHIVDSFNYTLDKVGNRLTKAGIDANIAYTYDAIYRLQQASGSHHHGAEQFTYDPMGNRLTGPDDELAYTYNAGNQLTDRSRKERHEEEKNTEYGYDKNGNLVKKIEHAEERHHTKTTLYSYDYENRLIKVETQKHNKQTIVSFTYDLFGRKLSKTVGKDEIEKDYHKEHGEDYDREDYDHLAQRATTYIYDNQDILMEYDQNGRVRARYVHGLGIDEHLAVVKKDEVYYYHADGLGSITALTDKKQKVVQTYEYDSFGNVKQHGDKIKQTYTFTGREWDTETDLYYYRARYYDAKAGRFISKDPIGFAGGINLYAYVSNNPVNRTDPSGLLAPYWHYGITYSAARNAGYSISDSHSIAMAVVNEDRNATDPLASAANNHAMAGQLFPGGPYQSQVQAIANALNIMQNGQLSTALHAGEDLPGHNGESMETFGWNFSTLLHIQNDLYPSWSTMREAYQNALNILKNKKPCK